MKELLALVLAVSILTMFANGYRFISAQDPNQRENATKWIVGSAIVCAIVSVALTIVAV